MSTLTTPPVREYDILTTPYGLKLIIHSVTDVMRGYYFLKVTEAPNLYSSYLVDVMKLNLFRFSLKSEALNEFVTAFPLENSDELIKQLLTLYNEDGGAISVSGLSPEVINFFNINKDSTILLR